MLAQVVGSDAPLDVKVAVGSALGRIAAAAVLLHVAPEHAAGELPAFAPRPAWR